MLIRSVVLLYISLFGLVAKAGTLRIGLIDYPPHIDYSEAIESSPLVKYFSTVLSKQEIDATFIRLPGDRALIELDKGQIDLILPLQDKISAERTLSKPVFHSIPGLCFRKSDFIPILSATHRLKNLTIGVASGIKPLPLLAESGAKIVPIKGQDAIKRGIDLTQRGRITAMYHPSLQKVYHRRNPLYKELACSYFHGYSTPVYIGVSNKLTNSEVSQIENAYLQSMSELSYEYFFALRK